MTVNETWKLLLNRMDIIPSCKSFPANTRSTYPLCDLLVLYFYFTHCMLVVSALYYWNDIQRGAAFTRAIEECAHYQQHLTGQDSSFLLRWEVFYFITSYENTDRIITLTLNLSTSHLTADTFQTLFLYLNCIWQKCQPLSYMLFKIKVPHQKSI